MLTEDNATVTARSVITSSNTQLQLQGSTEPSPSLVRDNAGPLDDVSGTQYVVDTETGNIESQLLTVVMSLSLSVLVM